MLSVAHVAKFVLSCTLLGSLSLRAARGGYQGRPRRVRDAREHMWEGRNVAVSPNSQLHVSVLVKTTAASSCLVDGMVVVLDSVKGKPPLRYEDLPRP